MRLLRPAEVMSKYNLSRPSLIKYEKLGYIHAYRTPAGKHRRYDENEIRTMLGLDKI